MSSREYLTIDDGYIGSQFECIQRTQYFKKGKLYNIISTARHGELETRDDDGDLTWLRRDLFKLITRYYNGERL